MKIILDDLPSTEECKNQLQSIAVLEMILSPKFLN